MSDKDTRSLDPMNERLVMWESMQWKSRVDIMRLKYTQKHRDTETQTEAEAEAELTEKEIETDRDRA